MLCPNDNARMRQIAAPSHYGQKVIIDQCEGCGGLWFDAFELYRVRPDADDILEDLDTESLREPSDIDSQTLRCPRDKSVLFKFDDPRFPSEIILMRCPSCQGFWLNRGAFTRFQQARKQLARPKEKTPEDKQLDEKVQRILDAHRARNSDDVLGSLGSFLSSPVGVRGARPASTSGASSGKEDIIDTVVTALVTILRIFILRS
jgi:Zn-finger nucleic acid-binding protein